MKISSLCFERFSLLLLIMSAGATAAESNYRFGYRLDYAVSPLKTSRINSEFSDLSSGHSSAFYVERRLVDGLALSMGPGAWNSESASQQFTLQYNSLGLMWRSGTAKPFLEAGADIGAGLAALSTGAGTLGEVQSPATVLRGLTGMYMLHMGIGAALGDWNLVLEARHFGFFGDAFSKLSSLTAGLSASYRI